MESELMEVKSLIRGLLISTPTATTVLTLKRDYLREVGQEIPFYKFGYKDLLSFLQSINDTVVIDFNPMLNSYMVVPVSSEQTAHVEKLVMKQKVSQPSSRKGAKLPRFNGFPTRRPQPLLVRRPPAVVMATPRSARDQLTDKTKCDIAAFVSSHHDGVPLHIIATRYLKDVVRTVAEAERLLKEVDSLEILNRLVYSARNKNNGITQPSRTDSYNEPTFKETRTGFSFTTEKNHQPSLENGHSSRQLNFQPNSNHQVVPADYDENEENDESDLEDINSMIDGYSGNDVCQGGFWEIDKPFKKLPISSSYAEGNNVTKGHTSTPKKKDSFSINRFFKESGNDSNFGSNSDDCSSGSYSNLISKNVEDNIRYLLQKHPEGILSSQFEKKYEEEFSATFKHTDFGFVSIIHMAAALRNLFKIVALSGSTDWNLFDANASVTEQSCVNGNPVMPSNVQRQILELVNRHPSGIESSQLEKLYEASYSVRLNPQGMGFADLEACLMALFDDLSLKYVNDKIYIHPIMEKWTDLFNNPPLAPLSVEDELEELNRLYPKEALRLDYVLPHEPLPPGLKPKSVLSILILSVISPVRWFFLKYENSTPFEDFMDELQVFYNAEGSTLKMHPKTILRNHLCVAEYIDASNNSRDWCRSRISKINPDGTVEVFFIDYGCKGTVKSSELKYLHQSYGGYPAQAFKGTMCGVKPPNGLKKWPEESCRTLLKLVSARGIQAEVVQVDYQNFSVAVHLVDTNTAEDMILSNVLVEKGLAEVSLLDEEEQKKPPQEEKLEQSFTEWKIENLEKQELETMNPGVASKQEQTDVMFDAVGSQHEASSVMQLPCLQDNKYSAAPMQANMASVQQTPLSSASSSSFTQFNHNFVSPQYGQQPLPPTQAWYGNNSPVQQSQQMFGNHLNSNWQLMNHNWPSLPIAKKPPPGFYPNETHKQAFPMQPRGPASSVFQFNYSHPQMPQVEFVRQQMSHVGFGCNTQVPHVGVSCPPQMTQMKFNPHIPQNAELCQKFVDFLVMQANSGLPSVATQHNLPFNPWLTNPGTVYNPPPIGAGSSSFQSTVISELPQSRCGTPKSTSMQSDTTFEEVSSDKPDSRDFSVQTNDCVEQVSTETVLNASYRDSQNTKCVTVVSEATLTRTETPPPATVDIPFFQSELPCAVQKLPQEQEIASACDIISNNLSQLDMNIIDEMCVDADNSQDADSSSFIYRSDDEEEEDDDDDEDLDNYSNDLDEKESESKVALGSGSPVMCDSTVLDTHGGDATIPEQVLEVTEDLSSQNPDVPTAAPVEKNHFFQLITVGNHKFHLFTVDGRDYISTAELNMAYSLFSTQMVLLNILTFMNMKVEFLELTRGKWKKLFEELDMCCDVAGLKKVNGRVIGKIHLTPFEHVVSILRAVSEKSGSQIKEFENWRCQLET